MVTLLITAFLVLTFLVVVLYIWQRPGIRPETHQLRPPSEPRSLFNSEQAVEIAQLTASETEQQRSAIVERARAGDKSTLKEAQVFAEPGVYQTVLNSLTDRAATDAELLSLISYVTRSELPVNSALARRVLESWAQSPNRSSTAKTLHIVALADDASLYNETVETVMKFWREGRLPDVKREELRALIEGEFWLLSNKTRSSGTGFLLKRTLGNARRELEAKVQVN